MKTMLQETTAEVVGLSTRKHQDWINEANNEIRELLESSASKTDLQAAKAAYKTACRTLQAKLRTIQNDW